MAASHLNRDDVVAAALEILDEYGLGDLTMRKLATALGVQPGALYWHFPNKQTLLGAVADRILAGVGGSRGGPGSRSGAGPRPEDPDPTDALADIARALRDALLAHRDGAELVAATYASRLTTAGARDAIVTVAQRAGLSRAHAELTGYTVLHYVLGHTVDEQAHRQLAEAGALTRARATDGPGDTDGDEALRAGDPAVRFEFGLGLLLDGLHARLGASATSPL